MVDNVEIITDTSKFYNVKIATAVVDLNLTLGFNNLRLLVNKF